MAPRRSFSLAVDPPVHPLRRRHFAPHPLHCTWTNSSPSVVGLLSCITLTHSWLVLNYITLSMPIYFPRILYGRWFHVSLLDGQDRPRTRKMTRLQVIDCKAIKGASRAGCFRPSSSTFHHHVTVSSFADCILIFRFAETPRVTLPPS